MKKNNQLKYPSTVLIRGLAAIITIGFLAFACTKEEDEPEDPSGGNTTGTPASNGSFEWTVGSGNSLLADSSVCYVQITTIYAYKAGNNNTIEINLSDIASGTYNITSFSGNELTLVQDGSTFKANSGSVQIKSSLAGKISGEFAVTFNNTTVSSLSGRFSDVKMR